MSNANARSGGRHARRVAQIMEIEETQHLAAAEE